MLHRFPTLLALLAPVPLAAQLTIQSSFDAGTDGWSHSGASVFKQEASGGNPGGFLYIDNSEGPVTWILAPSGFEGNLSAYDGGTISFDGKMLGTGGSPWGPSPQDYGNVYLYGGAGVASADLKPGVPPSSPGLPSTSQWEHYTLPLTASAFNTSPATWTAILANVTSLELSVEALFGAEIQGIDNVRIEAPIPAASCTVRNGHGINPLDFTCISPPVMGGIWQTAIATPPGTAATVVAVAPLPSAGFTNPFGPGELLIGAPPFFTQVSTGSHAINVPTTPAIAGVQVPTQGFRVTSGLAIAAMNAIDLVVGL